MRKTTTSRVIVHVYIFHTYKHMCIVMFMFFTCNTCGVYFHTNKNQELYQRFYFSKTCERRSTENKK